MLNLEVIQLFVYLMAPLLSSMREQDFQTLKLENGLRLWQQLWAYRLGSSVLMRLLSLNRMIRQAQ